MKRVVLSLALMALSAGAAYAQGTGTVTINGSVGNAASIRWWGFTAVGSGTGSNAPAAQNGPLSFTLDMGDVAAGTNTDTYTGGTVQLMLRANNTYTLTAEVTSSAGFGGPPGTIALTDVGFGLANLTNSGTAALVSGDPAGTSTIAGSFGNDPSAAAKSADDVPTFATTLSNVSGAPTTVLSGPRISAGGGLGSPNNGLLVDAIFAIGPQLFSASGAFIADVEFTISSP